MKKLTAILLILVIVLSVPLRSDSNTADAATAYITVEEFAKALVNQMGLKPAEGSEASGYINCLINIGVVREGDYSNYKSALKRGDMTVLLSRADDYLNKPDIEEDLVQEVIEKRISDISKVASAKKEDVAKGFIKGFLKGYSNGAYSPDRELKVNNKIVEADALNCIKMISDKSLRAKISPDGQLIRTTNLPNNAYMFPYILASFPNRYYEAKLRFEGVEQRYNGKIVPMESPEDYTYPVDVAKARKSGIKDLNETKKKFMGMWLDKVYTRVWNTFNVNYKTIDDNWVETMAQTDPDIIYSSEYIYNYLNRYVKEMKNNKTIVECNKIAIDSSSMYCYNGLYYIRCYVHYRILSTSTKTKYTVDELDGRLWGPYNCILYARAAYVNLENYKLNKWVDGIFDVGLSTTVAGNDGSMYGVCDCNWSPGLFRSIERK